MSYTARRITAGQTILVRQAGSDVSRRFHATISPNTVIETGKQRAFGALADTEINLLKAHGESAIESSSIIIPELPYYLEASIGEPLSVEAVGPLVTRTYVLRSFSTPILRALDITRGTDAGGERMSGSKVSALSLSVNKGQSNASLSGTLMGGILELGVTPDAGVAAQTVAITGAPTEGDFTLTVLGETTDLIPFDATAEQVQAAFDDVLPGKVTVSGGPLPGQPLVLLFTNDGPVAAATATDTFDTGSVVVTVVAAGDEPELLDSISLLPGQAAVYIGTNTPDALNPTVNAGGGYLIQGWDWALSDCVVENHVLDGAGPGPKDFLPNVERTEELTVWMEGNAAGMAEYQRAQSGDQSGRWVSFVSNQPNGFQVVVHTYCKPVSVDNFGDESGSMGFGITYGAVHNNTLNGTTLIVVTTDQATL